MGKRVVGKWEKIFLEVCVLKHVSHGGATLPDFPNTPTNKKYRGIAMQLEAK